MARKKAKELIGQEKTIGHQIPEECLTEQEVKEAYELYQKESSSRKRLDSLLALLSKAEGCPFCRRIIFKIFGGPS